MSYMEKVKSPLFILIFGIALILTVTETIGSSLALPKDDKPGITKDVPGVRKLKDIVIYEDAKFYSSFPSVVKRSDGELLVAFRRAPDRKIFWEKGTIHVDPNSYLVMVRSHDGETWTKEPELIYANPFGGSNDPCLLQLRGKTLLCASYGWAFVRPDGLPNLKKPVFEAGGAIFLGGYLVRSEDGGKTWQDPTYPPHIEPEINFNALGKPLPAYNRGALYEGKSGRIFWVVAASDSNSPKKTSTYLLISDDKGLTWHYSSPVAIDNYYFNKENGTRHIAGTILEIK